MENVRLAMMSRLFLHQKFQEFRPFTDTWQNISAIQDVSSFDIYRLNLRDQQTFFTFLPMYYPKLPYLFNLTFEISSSICFVSTFDSNSVFMTKQAVVIRC